MSLAIAGIAMAGIGIAKGVSGFIKGRKAKKEEKRLKEQMAKRMEAMEGLDTSNPYADVKNQYKDMENTMEDLEVNTQQAEFERDAASQSQANVMSSMQEAGGFDAGNIQALVAGGAQAARQSSASIGQQESQNKMASAQQAGSNQEMERRGAMEVQALKGQGKNMSQQMEMNKQQALMGMTQGQLQTAQADKAAANQMMFDGASSAVGAFMMKDPKAKAGLKKRKKSTKKKATKKK
jgi:hypothetical protein|tara:strand:+ start:939 stop:1649 length:711 start_codon:yes stop_codon:yes gene_type:complete